MLGLALDKNPEIRCGDWEAARLDESQLRYAACDAHVAWDIVRTLRRAYTERCSRAGAAALSAAEWLAPLVEAKSRRRPHGLPPNGLPGISNGMMRSGGEPLVTAAEHGVVPSGAAATRTSGKAKAGDGGGSSGKGGGGGSGGGDGGVGEGDAPLAGALGSSGLRANLSRLGVPRDCARLVPAEEEEAAVSVKALAVFCVGQPVVALLRSDSKLDPFKLARHLRCSLSSRRAMSRQVRLATPDECVQVFGYVSSSRFTYDRVLLMISASCTSDGGHFSA